MKRHISSILFILLLITVNIACTKRTVVVTEQRKDNGKHKGWYKNPKNPHHPANARNTGGGNNTTIIVNNNSKTQVKTHNGNSAKPGNGQAHAHAKPGNGSNNNKDNGNASKGNGGGNGNSKGNSNNGNGNKGNGKK